MHLPLSSSHTIALIALCVLAVLPAEARIATHRGCAWTTSGTWKHRTLADISLAAPHSLKIRGGSKVEEEEQHDQYDYDQEYDEEEYDDEEEEDVASQVQIEVNVEKYDEPLVQSSMNNLMVSLGVMVLAKRVDLFSPRVVKLARFTFVSYLVVLQAFLFYVRVQAKLHNDRTPVTLKNPLSGLLQSQLQDNMVKNIASSFLSSKSTVMEYDLRQARSMQSGLIVNMVFMWFLHFKMNQVQPLIIQTATGLLNMVYSPLFQVYVLGRNLERPFQNPAMKNAMLAQQQAEDVESESKDDEATDALTTDSAPVQPVEESSDVDYPAPSPAAVEETIDMSEEEEDEDEDEEDDEDDEDSDDDDEDGASEDVASDDDGEDEL